MVRLGSERYLFSSRIARQRSTPVGHAQGWPALEALECDGRPRRRVLIVLYEIVVVINSSTVSFPEPQQHVRRCFPRLFPGRHTTGGRHRTATTTTAVQNRRTTSSYDWRARGGRGSSPGRVITRTHCTPTPPKQHTRHRQRLPITLNTTTSSDRR